MVREAKHGWQVSGHGDGGSIGGAQGHRERRGSRRSRAGAILLTLGGWTSARIAEAFGVREDTVRLWRSDFMADGVGSLRASIAPGPTPVKAAAALRVAGPLL